MRISIVGTEPGLGIVHRQIIPFLTNESGLVCPKCGDFNTCSWADDGESPEADWWECCECGATGAYLHPHFQGVTQNGVPLIGYSKLV